MLLSLLLSVGIVIAANPDYERFSRPTQVIPTIDGEWTTDDEWTDGEFTWIGTDVAFTSTYDGDMTRWIVEFITDTTDDSGDYFRFCIQGFPSQGAVARKLELFGHTNLAYFIRGGGDWTETDPVEGDFVWASSLSASPTSDTPHWIMEFQIDKADKQITMEDVWNFYLELFDKSNNDIFAWPPSADELTPDDWGIENYNPEPIPEGLTFAVMALLTTVSMLVGYRYFVKRKETKTQ